MKRCVYQQLTRRTNQLFIIAISIINVHCLLIASVKIHFLNMENIMDTSNQTELEAAVLRRLLSHLQNHTEVQNMDLMILADFCRNCLAKWYLAAAKENNVEMDYDKAREFIYGMPYSEWKTKHQLEATPEQLAAYEQAQSRKQQAKDKN